MQYEKSGRWGHKRCCEDVSVAVTVKWHAHKELLQRKDVPYERYK